MLICYILIIAIVVISLICIKTIKDIKVITDKEHVKAAFPKHSKWISAAFAGFFYLFIGINFSYIGEEVLILTLLLSPLLFGLFLYRVWLWFNGIIIYDEKGFSLGYLPKHIKYYFYNDVETILVDLKEFVVVIGEMKIDSKQYEVEVDAFRDCIMEHRIKNPVAFGAKEEKKISLDIECDVCPDGISVKYPFEGWNHFDWEDFQQVCICYNTPGTGQYWPEHHYDTIICFVKKGTKTNLFGYWNTGDYFIYRKVIPVKYTEKLYEQVKEKCPYPVEDLRNSRLYRKYGNKSS